MVGVRVSLPFVRFIVVLPVALSACQPIDGQDDSSASKGDLSLAGDFIGCYTVGHNEPAQIKINQTMDGFNMQIKDLDKPDVWDNPTPLMVMEADKGWDYFEVNTLDLHKGDVDGIIGRADGMMILAKVKDNAKNINPRLDSNYVMYIVQDSNTVYQVSCD